MAIGDLQQVKETISALFSCLRNLYKKDNFSSSDMFEIKDAKNNVISQKSDLSIEELIQDNSNSQLLELCAKAAFNFFVTYCKTGIKHTPTPWVFKEGQYVVSLKGLDKNISPPHKINFIKKAELNSNENQIPCLSTFLNAMESHLTSQLDVLSKEELNWNLNMVGLDTVYQTFKNNSIGCPENCPTCGRKCDRTGDDHRHGCDHGHQIRGMYGVQIGSSLSSRSCDEIKPDSEIMIDNLSKMKWREFVKKFPAWDFPQLDQNKIRDSIVTYKECWKAHGPKFCEHYSKLYGRELNFSLSQDSQTCHFILILDDSGSMEGKPWESARQAATNFVAKLKEFECSYSEAAVSCIIFHDKARTIARYKKLTSTGWLGQLVYQGGGTEFDPPLEQALDLIKAGTKFDKHVILFYTDGGASYPKATIDKYKVYSERGQISFYALSQESNPNCLISIANEIKQFGVGEVRNNITPDMLIQALPEVLNSMFHKVI